MIFLAVLLLAIVLPATFYIVLSSAWAHEHLRAFATEEISLLLGTEVKIKEVRLAPFSRLKLSDISILDDNDSIAACIREINARIEIPDLLFRGKVVVDYLTIDGMEGNLYRSSSQAPLNIDGIIRHLRARPKSDKESKINLTLNDLSITDSRFRYDVRSAEQTPGKFNPSHLSLSGLDLTIYAPEITNQGYTMELQHLSAREQSGLELTDLHFLLVLSDSLLSLSDFRLNLPYSRLQLATLSAPLPQGVNSLSKLLTEIPVDVAVIDSSYVYLPDVKAFVPAFARIPSTVRLRAEGSLARDSVILRACRVKVDNDGPEAMLSGNFFNLSSPEDFEFKELSFQVDATPPAVLSLLDKFKVNIGASLSKTLRSIPFVSLNGTAEGALRTGQGDITITSPGGRAVIITDYQRNGQEIYDINGTMELDYAHFATVFPATGVSRMCAHAEYDLQAGRKIINGTGRLIIDEITRHGVTFTDVALEAKYHEGALLASVTSDNPGAIFSLKASLAPEAEGVGRLEAEAEIKELTPAVFTASGAIADYTFASKISANLSLSLHQDNRPYEAILGEVALSDFVLKRASNSLSYTLPSLLLTLDSANPRGGLTIESNLLNGEINGYFVPSALVADVREIVGHCLPQLVRGDNRTLSNNFVFDFTIDKASGLCKVLGLPIDLVHAVSLSGAVDASACKASLAVDAPWLMQRDKVIENTVVSTSFNGLTTQSSLYASTLMPTKKGPMALVASLNALPGNVSTNIDWEIQRAIPISGQINFDTAFRRSEDNKFGVDIAFHPGTINFGQDVWQIAPSTIKYFDKYLAVNNFSLSTPTQHISINTPRTPLGDEKMTVSLTDINLIDIFETLEINNALIGGRATGDILVSDLFSGKPRIYSPGLRVNDISYNYCILGDAEVKMHFDNDMGAFVLNADVVNPEGRHSRIFGSITPATESLDITFLADKVKVGFLKPFMKAFASDIKGYASGRAHLFGTFKYIDLDADIYADSVQVSIDFTNTVYTASDSLRITPGAINLRDITITDVEGNKALLNGVVKHTFFSAPVFDFSITDAKDFLCYNVPEKLSPDWFGKIYGDGSAHVHGEPGVVDISVTMTTKQGSTFTFVLSDSEVADEYSFIEFHDATPVDVVSSVTEISTIPQAVLDYRARQGNTSTDSPTAYNLDIQADVTPQAQVIIVMDPIGGDRIRSFGTGNLRMTYGSVANDLRMYGTYTLDRGDYNFTLQDIIIKDFSIQPGSSITFRGDPYSAQLDLQAVYAVNANLSDLDESFLSDKELNRTKVPVHALMKVTGDMRQPSIDFDLNFPTLTSDTYRKVRSIVSTDEMMNRQIIYLLALNRFYTPDYMASTTRGNELFSVASATLGSQLSNMLGKLSENWSISPNLRSERGDFSDLEVDLTLSSTLLNNRLLFNGNLGYRDKSLNTNRFVGDFDIEYLLNRRGTWRLKAYNRYNDQNYYLRTAQTTQGIGIMYRRDFDNLFNFLKPKRNDHSGDKK